MDFSLTATRSRTTSKGRRKWPPPEDILQVQNHEHDATVVYYLGYMVWDNGEVTKTGDKGIVTKRPYIEPSLSNTVRLLEKTLRETTRWVDVKFESASVVHRVRLHHLYLEGFKPEIHKNFNYGQKVRWVCEDDCSIELPATRHIRMGDVGEVMAPSVYNDEVVVKFESCVNHFSCPVELIEADSNVSVRFVEESPDHKPWLGPEEMELQIGTRVQYLGHWEWYRGDLIPKDIIHTGDGGTIVKKPYVSKGRKYIVVRFDRCKKVRPVRMHRVYLEGSDMPKIPGRFGYFDKIVNKSDGEKGEVVAPSTRPRWVVVKWKRLTNAVGVREDEIELAAEPVDKDLPWFAPPESKLTIGQPVYYLGYHEWTSRGRGPNVDISQTGDRGYVTSLPYTRASGGRFVDVKFDNCNNEHPVRLWRLYLPFPDNRAGPEQGRPDLPLGFFYGQKVKRIDYGDTGIVVAPHKGGSVSEDPARVRYPRGPSSSTMERDPKIIVKFDNMAVDMAVAVDHVELVDDDDEVVQQSETQELTLDSSQNIQDTVVLTSEFDDQLKITARR